MELPPFNAKKPRYNDFYCYFYFYSESADSAFKDEMSERCVKN